MMNKSECYLNGFTLKKYESYETRTTIENIKKRLNILHGMLNIHDLP